MKKEVYKAGFILGIVSIGTGMLSPLVGLVVGIIGIVFSAIKLKKKECNKVALIICIVGVIVSIVSWIVAMIVLKKAGWY